MIGILAFTITINAGAVAWYGAIVATLSALAAGYSVWRDRTHLTITAKPNYRLLEPVGNFTTEEDIILIDAANTGRRPVKLDTVWFEAKGMKKGAGLFVKSSWEPSKKIEEGESATMLCRQKNIVIADLKRVVVRDATGHKWHGCIEKTKNKSTDG